MMDWVIRACLGRLDAAGASTRLLEERGNRGVAPITRHVDERVAVEVRVIRLCSGVEQASHVVDAAIAHGFAELTHRKSQ